MCRFCVLQPATQQLIDRSPPHHPIDMMVCVCVIGVMMRKPKKSKVKHKPIFQYFECLQNGSGNGTPQWFRTTEFKETRLRLLTRSAISATSLTFEDF